MSDPEKKYKNPKMNPKHPPLAPFVWLMILLAFAVLLVFRFNPSLGSREEWTPAEFERNLKDGLVTVVDITPESDRILYLEGLYVNRSAAPGEADLSDAQGASHGFSTRLYSTDELINTLQNSKTVKVTYLQRDNWWKGVRFTAISNTPSKQVDAEGIQNYGLSPFPAGAEVDDGYWRKSETGWTQEEIPDADEVYY